MCFLWRGAVTAQDGDGNKKKIKKNWVALCDWLTTVHTCVCVLKKKNLNANERSRQILGASGLRRGTAATAAAAAASVSSSARV